jgi:hypothetical protein
MSNRYVILGVDGKPLTVSSPIPVTDGGTGATTVTGALTNLGLLALSQDYGLIIDTVTATYDYGSVE